MTIWDECSKLMDGSAAHSHSGTRADGNSAFFSTWFLKFLLSLPSQPSRQCEGERRNRWGMAWSEDVTPQGPPKIYYRKLSHMVTSNLKRGVGRDYLLDLLHVLLDSPRQWGSPCSFNQPFLRAVCSDNNLDRWTHTHTTPPKDSEQACFFPAIIMVASPSSVFPVVTQTHCVYNIPLGLSCHPHETWGEEEPMQICLCCLLYHEG